MTFLQLSTTYNPPQVAGRSLGYGWFSLRASLCPAVLQSHSSYSWMIKMKQIHTMSGQVLCFRNGSSRPCWCFPLVGSSRVRCPYRSRNQRCETCFFYYFMSVCETQNSLTKSLMPDITVYNTPHIYLPSAALQFLLFDVYFHVRYVHAHTLHRCWWR